MDIYTDTHGNHYTPEEAETKREEIARDLETIDENTPDAIAGRANLEALEKPDAIATNAARVFELLPPWDREETPDEIAEDIRKDPAAVVGFLLDMVEELQAEEPPAMLKADAARLESVTNAATWAAKYCADYVKRGEGFDPFATMNGTETKSAALFRESCALLDDLEKAADAFRKTRDKIANR